MSLPMKSISFRKFFDHNGQVALSAQWPINLALTVQLPCFQVYAGKTDQFLDTIEGLEQAMHWCRLIIISMGIWGFHKEHLRMRLEVYNGGWVSSKVQRMLMPPALVAHAIAEREQRNAVECLLRTHAEMYKLYTLICQTDMGSKIREKLRTEYAKLGQNLKALLESTGTEMTRKYNAYEEMTITFAWSQTTENGIRRHVTTYPRGHHPLATSGTIFGDDDTIPESPLSDSETLVHAQGEEQIEQTKDNDTSRPNKKSCLTRETVQSPTFPGTKIPTHPGFVSPIWPQSFRRANIQPYHNVVILILNDDIETHGVHIWRFHREENINNTEIQVDKWSKQPLHQVSVKQDGIILSRRTNGTYYHTTSTQVGQYLLMMMHHFSRAGVLPEYGGSCELFPGTEHDVDPKTAF